MAQTEPVRSHRFQTARPASFWRIFYLCHTAYNLMCAVLSGGGTALLLSPGTGNMQVRLRHRRRDTSRRRRQLTKLPGPIPQNPPLTLRYGCLRLSCHASGVTNTGQLFCFQFAFFMQSLLQSFHRQSWVQNRTVTDFTCILILSGNLSHYLSRCSNPHNIPEAQFTT